MVGGGSKQNSSSNAGPKGTTAAAATNPVSQEFEAFYLQRAAREFAEDLDKIRSADDFKADNGVPMLVHALRQGASMFSPADQRRVLDAAAAGEEEEPRRTGGSSSP